MSKPESPTEPPIVTFDEFMKLDIRIGTVTDVQPFAKARKPAFKIWVDFGSALGVKKSSAQITEHYTPDSLIGQQVMAVVNFSPRQIADFMSEILILGFMDENNAVVLAKSDKKIPNGKRLC